jgi:hypothetical protein
MHDKTTMIVVVIKIQHLEVRYRHNFAVAKETTLDFTGIPGRTTFKSIAPDNEKHLTTINLGKTLFSFHLVVEANSLLLLGEVMDPTIRDHYNKNMAVNSDNTIELYANDISLSSGAFITAAKIMMYAQNDIIAEDGAHI